jgi:hypothetical protein
MTENEPAGGPSVDISKGVEIDGQTFFPLMRPLELNPCAGKNDGTSCGAGWGSSYRISEGARQARCDLRASGSAFGHGADRPHIEGETSHGDLQ